MENNCVKLFCNPSTIASYGPDKHAHTPNCCCNNYVMLTASWLNKKEKTLLTSIFFPFTIIVKAAFGEQDIVVMSLQCICMSGPELL